MASVLSLVKINSTSVSDLLSAEIYKNIKVNGKYSTAHYIIHIIQISAR